MRTQFRQATLLCGRNRESHIFHNAIVAYEGTPKNMHDDFLSWGFCIPKISKQPKIAT